MLEGALHQMENLKKKKKKHAMTAEETDCQGKEKSFFLIFEQGTLNFHFLLGPQIM